MADNTQLNSGTGGDLIHTDDTTQLNSSIVSGFKTEVVKVAYGDNGIVQYVSKSFPLPITNNTKPTYRASTTALLTTAVTASVPWLMITGSATKLIRVQSVIISGVTLTAVAYMNIGVGKYSTASTGGTSSALTKVPLDSTDPASTVGSCLVYTVGPTAGTKIGDISCRRQMGQATTAAASGIPEEIKFDFSDNKDGGAVMLRVVAENLGIYWITAPATAPSLLVRVEYCESTD